MALSVSTLVPGLPSRAAVPTPGAGEAVVTVFVSDVRTGPTTVGPLMDATFGLFRTRPADSTVGADGFTSATPDFTCVSDADGDCSFVVPIGTAAGQIPQGTRMWLAAVAGPSGYYINPYWQTAPLTGGVSVNNRLLWPTPALVAGQTYRSGAQWITDPGLAAIAGSPEASQTDYTRRAASGGMVGLSRVNPPMPTQCGLNVALVADLSSSMTSASVISLKSAMDAFVNALQGTPSQVALFTFGTDSPANGYPPNTGLQSVATTADANLVKAQYAAWNDNTPTNYTNWDRGLAAVAGVNGAPGSSTHIDLVVLITDGNPTVYGPSPAITGGTGYTRFRELDAARASANQLKSQDSRVVAVGVGTGAQGAGTAYNLETISGQTPYSGGNIVDADYIQTTDYTAVGAALRSLVLSGCAPSISVAKRIVPYGGTIADAYIPAEPWQFAAASLTSPATITPASAMTNGQTGAISFDVTLNDVDPGTFSIDETMQAGYSIYPVNADGTDTGSPTQNAACVDKSSGTDVPVTVTNDGTTGFEVDVGLEGIISCVVYNQAPDFESASVVVYKRWRVVTEVGIQDYPHGAQPGGLYAQASLTGPSGAGASVQQWEQERAGYSVTTDSPVTLSENVTLRLPECTLTDVTVEDGAPEANPPASGTSLSTTTPTVDMPLTAGVNEWTFTNVVTCQSFLTLSKVVDFGPATSTMWTLEAFGPGGALPGPSGRDGDASVTKVEVTPNVDYQLAETPDASPEYLSHYVQDDVRSQPLIYPQSTGSWMCTADGLGPRLIFGNEGAISVPLGEHMECVTHNNVAMLNIQKAVQGGTALPSDFTFTVAPVAPILPGGHSHDVPGAAGPTGYTITLRPDQYYQVTETGPPGYEMTGSPSTFCITAQAVLDRNDLVLPPGGLGACLITNHMMSLLSVLKVDAATGLPLAGAVFDLAKDSNGNSVYDAGIDVVVGTCTTGAAGTCSVSGIDFGTYFWVERTAPPGYQRPGGAVSGPIVINAGNSGSAFAVTTVRNSQVLSSISLIKVDVPGGSPLADAVFQLYRSASGLQPGDDPAPGDEAVGPPCTTPASGICTVSNLPFGDYFWYEVSPPPGYSLPTDRTTPLVTLNAANAGTTIPAYQFTNPRLPGAAEVLKVDEVDRSVLPGGTFNLYLDDGDGVFDPAADSLVGQCTTNATGTCRLADLDFGTYFWVEVSPPIGYDLPADTVSALVEITTDNITDIQRVTFADPRSPDWVPSDLPRTGGFSWQLLPFAAAFLTAGAVLAFTWWRRARMLA
ncbi:MAG: SpaA isopeptide-forming pilin-related protein [Micrococcales bacterium]|nr:SpaA isopeptide-forming pilin-related protein [Micrococcales bacterium]